MSNQQLTHFFAVLSPRGRVSGLGLTCIPGRDLLARYTHRKGRVGRIRPEHSVRVTRCTLFSSGKIYTLHPCHVKPSTHSRHWCLCKSHLVHSACATKTSPSSNSSTWFRRNETLEVASHFACLQWALRRHLLHTSH